MTDAISASAVVADVAPYALALLPVVIGWGVAEFRKYTRIPISQAAVDKLNTLAQAEAGAMVAASETNLAGVAINVASPEIAAAAARIIAAAPGLLDDAGLSPDHVATMIAGHIGVMQASAAAPPLPAETAKP
jgi:hypothetical protein